MQRDWNNASLESLVEHITSTHHEYVKRELPRLNTLAEKVIARHGSTHAEVAADSCRDSEAGFGADAAPWQRGTGSVSLTSQTLSARWRLEAASRTDASERLQTPSR